MKMSVVQRITLAGMLLILTVLGTRLPALITAGTPISYIRLSLGPSFIIFSSILLGPLWGAIIGGVSDLLGAIIFPTTLSGFSINPWITLMYTLLGILPWFLFFLTKKVKKLFTKPYAIYILMSALWVFVLIYFLFNDSFKYYGGSVKQLTLGIKIGILVVSLLLTIGLAIALHFTNKRFMDNIDKYNDIPSPYQIAFISLICEVLIMLLLGSFVKSLYYEIDFLFLFLVQAMMLFIDVALNTFMVSLLLVTFKRVNTY